MDEREMSIDPTMRERHQTTRRLVPNAKVESIGLEEIWAYRHLLIALFQRDIIAIKNQTPLAWFWRVIAPIFTLLTYTILFEQIGKVDFGTGVPYIFIMSAAMLPWNLFSAVVTGSVGSIATNVSFFSKVYFPRIILPLVSMTSAVVDFVLTATLLLALLLYMGMPLSLDLIAVPFFAAWALLLGLGFGLWLAAINALYRDIRHGLPYAIQLGFLLSPVAYPITAVPERFRDLYHLNPLVGIIGGFRWAFLQQGEAPSFKDLIAFVVTCLFAISGIWAFKRVERVFADVI